MSHAIDLLVAEHVMKLGPRPFMYGPLRFSSNLNDAMLVVDHINKQVASDGDYRDGFRLEWDGEQWNVGFTESTDCDCRDRHFEFDSTSRKLHAYTVTYGSCRHESLPTAICLYALKFHGIAIPSPGTPCASNLKASPGDSVT